REAWYSTPYLPLGRLTSTRFVFGLFSLTRVDSDTGARSEELLGCGSCLHRKIDKEVVFTYNGPFDGVASIAIEPSTTVGNVKITLNDADDTSSPYVWDINGTTSFYALKTTYIDTTDNFTLDIGKIGRVVGTVSGSDIVTCDDG